MQCRCCFTDTLSAEPHCQGLKNFPACFRSQKTKKRIGINFHFCRICFERLTGMSNASFLTFKKFFCAPDKKKAFFAKIVFVAFLLLFVLLTCHFLLISDKWQFFCRMKAVEAYKIHLTCRLIVKEWLIPLATLQPCLCPYMHASVWKSGGQELHFISINDFRAEGVVIDLYRRYNHETGKNRQKKPKK